MYYYWHMLQLYLQDSWGFIFFIGVRWAGAGRLGVGLGDICPCLGLKSVLENCTLIQP